MAALTGCGPNERVLVPDGAQLDHREERVEQCYTHHVLVFKVPRERAAAWAAGLGLACEPDGGSPCMHWSKGATGENFWAHPTGVLDGYDTLDARFDGERLRVDH